MRSSDVDRRPRRVARQQAADRFQTPVARPRLFRIAELANREARIVYNKELKNWNTQQT